MEYLYVCLFSNGHIKVGRSIDPASRIASHAARVSCIGVELLSHKVFECAGRSDFSERQLIERCADECLERNQSEWFVGLDFDAVCLWAHEFSSSSPVVNAGAGMTTRDVIAHFGSQVAIAKALGIKQPSVATWGEFPPDRRQLQIERLTNGALKAEPGCLDRLIGADRVPDDYSA